MIADDTATSRGHGDQIMTELTCSATSSRRHDTGRPDDAAEPPRGAWLDAIGISHRVGTRQILQKMSLSIEPGELVAIAGGSGAGKTTLLEILAGLQPPSAGEVRHDGVLPVPDSAPSHRIGYVPQDDIIHLEMPLRRTLRYAARLRLPAGTSAAEADRIVEETMRRPRPGRSGRGTGPCAVRRPAQARQYRRGATDPAAPFLPRRTHLGAGPVDRGRRDAAAAPAQPARGHRRPDDARAGRHRPVRPGGIPGPRRPPGLHRQPDRGSALLRRRGSQRGI